MAVTLTYPTLTTSPASKTELEANFTVLAQKFGNITNADVASSAGIDVDKLSAQYEYMLVKLSGATTSTAIVDFAPIPNSGGAWTVSAVTAVQIDGGSGNPTIRIQYGYYTQNSTTFNVSTNVTAATAIVGSGTLGDGNNAQQSIAVTGSSITPSSNLESLVLNITANGTASGTIYVTVLLKRKITA